jgi:hypothetical protein
MDVNGAKALKRRLGPNGADDASPPSTRADVPADAPPVYHWTGVSQAASNAASADPGDDESASGMSLFRRLGLSFR